MSRTKILRGVVNFSWQSLTFPSDFHALLLGDFSRILNLFRKKDVWGGGGRFEGKNQNKQK